MQVTITKSSKDRDGEIAAALSAMAEYEPMFLSEMKPKASMLRSALSMNRKWHDGKAAEALYAEVAMSKQAAMNEMMSEVSAGYQSDGEAGAFGARLSMPSMGKPNISANYSTQALGGQIGISAQHTPGQQTGVEVRYDKRF